MPTFTDCQLLQIISESSHIQATVMEKELYSPGSPDFYIGGRRFGMYFKVLKVFIFFVKSNCQYVMGSTHTNNNEPCMHINHPTKISHISVT